MKTNLLGQLVGPLIVGVIVLVGQAFLQPWVAEGVKRKESILEQRYKACNDAFDLLLRKLERSSISKRGEVIYVSDPTTEKLTAIEFNTIYCRLALFGSNSLVPKEFARLIRAKSLKISDIGEFVLKVRKEMDIKGEGILSADFDFAHSTKKPEESFDGMLDKLPPDESEKPKDSQKQY